VRLVLMPALLSLFGKVAWWMPGWLGRIIPNIDIEGHALDAHNTANAPLAGKTTERELVDA